MNKLPEFLISIGLLIVCFPVYAQFTAEMIQVQKGKKKIYKVSSDKTRYRYDFEDSGMKGVVIVDPGSNKTAILFPEKKYVHYTEPQTPVSLMNDPFQAYRYTQKHYSERNLGNEKISGFNAIKTELYSADKKLFSVWYSEELQFLLKMVNENAENTYVELTDIKQTSIDPELFNIPKDYISVDEKMRPIVPEPPPPDTWKDKKLDVPFNEVVNRGDRIRFTITYDKYSKLLISNDTDSPAKIIWYVYRNDQKLPDNEQGPVKYRTRRLFSGENENLTYNWKSGDKIEIECYEGKMSVEVKPE